MRTKETVWHCRTDHDRLDHEHVCRQHSPQTFAASGINPSAGRGGINLKASANVARTRFRVEADVVDLCPPRPARIKDFSEHSRRAGHRRDAQRTRTGESLHRWAASTLIPADPQPEDQRQILICRLFIRFRRDR